MKPEDVSAEALDAIAEAIHETYRRNQARRKPEDDPAMRPWSDLPEPLRESNRQQAEHITRKLDVIGCGFTPASADRHLPRLELARAEIERLSEMEHDRWVEERRRDGWTFGTERDPERKISPYLVPWEELLGEIKEYGREAVRAIPEVLAEAGFEVYRR